MNLVTSVFDKRRSNFILHDRGPADRDDESVEGGLRRLGETEAKFAERDGKGIPIADVLAESRLKLDHFRSAK